MRKCSAVVAEADSGIRLDRWFRRNYPEMPFVVIAKLVREHEILLDGRRAGIAIRVASGQVISFPAFVAVRTSEGGCGVVRGDVKCGAVVRGCGGGACDRRSGVANEKRVLIAAKGVSVLFQNSHCVVVNKPCGMATQGGRGVVISVDAISGEIAALNPLQAAHCSCAAVDGTVPGIGVGVEAAVESCSTISGAVVDAHVASCDVCNSAKGNRLKIVHRLDRDTTGVLLLARSSGSAARIAQSIRDGLVHKTYIAILCGVPSDRTGTISMDIRQYGKNGQCETKHSITEYRVLDSTREMSVVEFRPITGRKHQLRIHSAAIRCPILGDRKYSMFHVANDMDSAVVVSDAVEHHMPHDEVASCVQFNACLRSKYRKFDEVKKVSALVKSSRFLHLHALRITLDIDGEHIDVTAPLPVYFYKTAVKFGLRVDVGHNAM